MVSGSGCAATEYDLRLGAETAYRQLAALTEHVEERVRLVDAANRIRPRTHTENTELSRAS